ncbi:type II toxin-antitoxin system antitoxin SocA domain-containing protein [Ectobacillus funiculus]|uniref:Type II toxin-antitoxin system antitoxin SocA domain-containing protein n=1 Tax=Ectobacillus funiculus TaxID=137993 RepID=A0ABV5WEY8_9BACI
MTLRKFCIHCLERTPVELVSIPEKAEIQGETITYDAKYYFCSKCEQLTPNDDLTEENLDLAYKKYREKKGMLQPKDFLYIREEIYQVSLRVMAKLLGCSPATLSRYENGALQSKQHDLQFKTLRDPRVMKTLLKSSIDEIPEKDRRALQERLSFLLDIVKSVDILKGLEDELHLLNLNLETEWEETAIEEVEKFFIIKGQEFKDEDDDLRVSPLKLQKLMYYAQGWTYAFTGHKLFRDDFQAWIHGPVVPHLYDKYKKYGSRRIDEDLGVKVEELSLSFEQLQILHWVWDKYSKFEAKFLEDLTHMEFPWIQARGDLPNDRNCNWIIKKEDIESFFKSMSKTLQILRKV